MHRYLIRKIKKHLNLIGLRSGKKYQDINPEDIFLDSANLPGFEGYRLEGRIEKPVPNHAFLIMKMAFFLSIFLLVLKVWVLGVRLGPVYAEISEINRLEQTIIFANRGVIYDRNGLELVSNTVNKSGGDFAERIYATFNGLAHLVGYVKYPLADNSGVYYETQYKGRDGVELAFDELLQGKNGLKLKETDVRGEIISESIIEKPQDGASLVLSIDAKVTEAMHQAIAHIAKSRGFIGGAGVIMNVHNGEIIAMTSYPEYDQKMLTSGKDRLTINLLIRDPAKPFLNRAIGGLYTPGSIIKPIVALAALNEGIISPSKKILSTGSIIVQNPYDPSKPSIFGDWKAHGWTDMREAIAVSSDTYFYSIGGGYGDQKGLGITALDRYFRLFGITEKTGVELLGEASGVIPTPEWKREKFNGEIWRLGDTYITAIGQYGTQLTPINAARFTAAIANGGYLLKPTVILGGSSNNFSKIEFREEDLQVVREGMRAAVTHGTAIGLNAPYMKFAAKTGTAEIGAAKLYVNSWSIGFFPADDPIYAWALVMERGPRSNTIGATAVIRELFDWMAINAPQYFD